VWTGQQRTIIVTLLIALLMYLSVRRALHGTFIPDPQPLEGSRAADLADRLDPNSANQAEIAAIPGVGEKLAGAIVEYRQEFIRVHSGQLPFHDPTDLLAIRGVGVAKMEAMQPYLLFPPARRPATKP
jgi:Helix-hairpin-helix motif